MKSFLIIDDDIEFCDMLRHYLSFHDIRLNAKHDGSTGLAEVRSRPYDMLLLDVMLPDMDGYEVLRRLKTFSRLGVLMLSTLGSEDDRILGLGQGADDYLPKPFNPRELVARAEAILRRLNPVPALPPRVPPEGPGMVVNHTSREAYYRGGRLPLTDIEFSLLCIFLESPGTVLEREDLVTRVFQRPFNPLDRSLDMHISRLRRKLAEIKDSVDPIKTIRSSGYLLSPQFANRCRQLRIGAHSR
jgi:two-component system response regulator CpxR